LASPLVRTWPATRHDLTAAGTDGQNLVIVTEAAALCLSVASQAYRMSAAEGCQMEVPMYSLAERDRRWALARRLMAAENVDALVACGGLECAGAAGFAPDAYFSNDLPGSVVIFCRDTDPVRLVWSDLAVQARMEAAGRGGQMWIGPADDRVGADAAQIAEVLCRHGLERAPVGVLGPGIAAHGHSGSIVRYPPWRDVLARLPQVRFKQVDLSFLFAAVCLSEEEVAVVRYCAAAGDAAARAMAAVAAPGVTEAEVCAAGTAAASRLGCPASTLLWSGPGFVVSGPPSCRPEPPRALAEGDVLLAEVTTWFGMRGTRHQAAIAIGDPHPDIETAAVIACASYQAGVRAARVGNTFGDLAEAMLMPLKQAGSRQAHPLARVLSAPGPVGRELPLAPGMCCALGPSAVIAGRAVSLGGTVLVGEDDPIELSPFTARMLRVPAVGRHGQTP
jgi:Xaa-Pro aminopeptidase